MDDRPLEPRLLRQLGPATLVALAAVAPAVVAREAFAHAAPRPQEDGRSDPAPPRRPNILFFMTDDHSWCHVGAYGCGWIDTPNFDRIAAEGVRFEHAFAAAPRCSPSRAAILAGQEIWRLGEGGEFGKGLPADVPYYPGLLEEAGYVVGWTGKGWGPGQLDPADWDGRDPCGREVEVYYYFEPDREVRSPRPITPKRFWPSAYDTAYAANFQSFLRSTRGRPFAFWCGTLQPHRPYVPGSGVAAGKRLEDVDVPEPIPDLPEVRSDLLDYALMVEYADARLGELLDLLEETGHAENTIVVVTSDQGIALPRCKGDLYDLGTRVPLAIRWPARVSGGRVVDDLVGLIDLAPTFLEAAGAPVPEAMTGRSLLPLLLSEESGTLDPARTAVFTAKREDCPVRAVRTRDWLYVRNYDPEAVSGDAHYYVELGDSPEVQRARRMSLDGRPPEELYELATDPWQVHDVAGDPSKAAVLERLRERLEAYQEATGDEHPEVAPPYVPPSQRTPSEPDDSADDASESSSGSAAPGGESARGGDDSPGIRAVRQASSGAVGR